MNLSEEQLKEVEEMGGLFFSPMDIAINLELEDDDREYFVAAIECKNMNNPIVRAFQKGWLTTEVELRKAIKQSAMNGSSPSQGMMMNYQREGRV
ncbi:hypothetical protein [Sunxiuqinia sp. sy24]|uniref:hypothetical protein n=1 Tax=Sunxiuqinia sp. sy24 TaxID=3461495 RepID=UPI00404672BF